MHKYITSTLIVPLYVIAGTAMAAQDKIQANPYPGVNTIFPCKLEHGTTSKTLSGDLQDVHLYFQNPGPAALNPGSTLNWELTKTITYKAGKNKDKEQVQETSVWKAYTLAKAVPAKQWHKIKTFTAGYVFKPVVGYKSYKNCSVTAGDLKFSQTPGGGVPASNLGTGKFGSKVTAIKQGMPATSSPAQPKLPDLPAGAKKLPDITIEKLSALPYKDCNTNRAIAVSLRVKNNGNANFPMLNGKQTLLIHAGPPFYDKGLTLPSLAPGQIFSKQLIVSSTTNPASLAGKQVNANVILNQGHAATETDYSNNVKPFTVAFPMDHCKLAQTGRAGQAAPATRTPPSTRTPPASRSSDTHRTPQPTELQPLNLQEQTRKQSQPVQKLTNTVKKVDDTQRNVIRNQND